MLKGAQLLGTFTDPTLPKGFTPYNIQAVGDVLYVTYSGALGPILGFVDVFDTREGARYGRLAHLSTVAGARTGLWVPEMGRLFVAAPHRGREAGIHVFEAPPATASAPVTGTPPANR